MSSNDYYANHPSQTPARTTEDRLLQDKDTVAVDINLMGENGIQTNKLLLNRDRRRHLGTDADTDTNISYTFMTASNLANAYSIRTTAPNGLRSQPQP
ncbi:uncharacterized protein I303_101357 [Kwoniella dejecticola CBS 10117]|uniref:Uncharacterized protein n=1 Tax=Kwoniella dejecticola CBS 10117 TaxID=1296121 RepID=A0A1A6AHK0_9TREE|nr:uncharacterized protein I303_01367 [Kwoniella dejecticola CBS 10117]OBR89539.1 hypothetical protein I303_01367 [Kwoniella dejecticola CBS 10117]